MSKVRDGRFLRGSRNGRATARPKIMAALRDARKFAWDAGMMVTVTDITRLRAKLRRRFKAGA